MGYSRFFGAALLVVVAALVELRGPALFGFAPDAVLMVLVALGALVGAAELIILVLLGVWLLAWQPGFSWELFLVAALPLLAGLRNKMVPWQSWFSTLIALLLAPLAFYGIVSPNILVAQPLSFLKLSFVDLVIGLVVFEAFRRIFPRRRRELLT